MEVGESVGAVGPEVADAGEEVLHAGVVPPGRGEVQRRVAERESFMRSINLPEKFSQPRAKLCSGPLLVD